MKKYTSRVFSHYIYKTAAQISYYNIVAFITMSAIAMCIARFFPDMINDFIEEISVIMPAVANDVLNVATDDIHLPEQLSVLIGSIIITIHFTSRSFHSMIFAFDRIYEIKGEKKVVKAKVISILFTLGLMISVVLLFYLSIVGDYLTAKIADIGEVSVEFINVFTYLKRFGPIFLVFVLVTAIYMYLPNIKVKLKHALPGALFTTAGWMLITVFYSYYVSNLSAFSVILGGFGSLFFFLIWIYWLSILLLFGAEINAAFIIKRKEEK